MKSHKDTRVLVHHPGSNHLAYNLVAALQREGFDCRFETGFFFRERAPSARLARALPGKIGARALRELKRRHHPEVDVARVGLRPFSELVYVAANRMGLGSDRLARVIAWRNDRFDAAVARQVRRTKPDVVIGHDGSALLAARAARASGALAVLNQVVGHVETALEIFREEAATAPEFAEAAPTLPAPTIERHRAEIAEADRILVPSDYVRDTLVARGADPARLAILPYGVDIQRFRPAPKAVRPGLRLLFVGHIGSRKGIRYLLEAVRRLGPEVTLTLVGRITCDPAALAPWRDAFRHVPHVPFHEVHTLFQDADVFVYPSLHEGSAFATYEALASGLPVVTTLNSGSVVRDGIEGAIVPIRDVDALVAAIARLRDPALRATMAAAARARAEEFTWGHYAARLAALLDSWLLERSAASVRAMPSS
jgi:glycosyltransferase involved in cell wall biosynthesis